MRDLGRRGPPSDLVWIQTGFIGDVVLTTAAVELARRAFPATRQHVVTTPVGARVLAGAEGLASRLVFDKGAQGSYAAFRAVKKQLVAALGTDGGYVVLLQTHRSPRSSLLCRYLGFETVTYKETPLGYLAARRVARVATLHEAARIALLLEPLGVARTDIVDARPRLTALPLGEEGWQQRLRAFKGRVVAVAPGSVWGTKRWTPDGFAELTRRLLADDTTLVVFLGSDGEKSLTQEIAAKVGRTERLVDLAGQTTLDDLRRIFPRLALLVANDSSPIHYASAFDVPTVALFGATVPGMGFAPLARGSRTLGVDLGCRPCSDHGPQVCPLGHFRCMRDLDVGIVEQVCREVLSTAEDDGRQRSK